MTGKKILFILLLVVFCVTAAHNLGLFKGSIEDSTEAGRNIMPKLRLDLLERERPAYSGVKRDIFSLSTSLRQKATAIIEAPEPLPLTEGAPLQPSEIEVFASKASYIGLLDKKNERTVFINIDNGVLTVKKGDVIGARFRVEDITENKLFLKDSTTGDEASITFSTASN